VSPSKVSGVVLRAGDVVRIESAGGGGFGDPFEREPELVLRDVRTGVVSREAARHEYGVAIAPEGDAVDAAGTAGLRAR
jgi:N-methylhydantoinase B